MVCRKSSSRGQSLIYDYLYTRFETAGANVAAYDTRGRSPGTQERKQKDIRKARKNRKQRYGRVGHVPFVISYLFLAPCLTSVLHEDQGGLTNPRNGRPPEEEDPRRTQASELSAIFFLTKNEKQLMTKYGWRTLCISFELMCMIGWPGHVRGTKYERPLFKLSTLTHLVTDESAAQSRDVRCCALPRLTAYSSLHSSPFSPPGALGHTAWT